MNLTHALALFANDTRILVALAVIGVDFVLGVTASLVAPAKAGKFNLAKLSGFLKDDVLGKLVPWGVCYVLWKVLGPSNSLSSTLSIAETAIYATMTAAWAGSIATSLGQLGVNVPIPMIGSEHTPSPAARPTAPKAAASKASP